MSPGHRSSLKTQIVLLAAGFAEACGQRIVVIDGQGDAVDVPRLVPPSGTLPTAAGLDEPQHTGKADKQRRKAARPRWRQ